MAATADGVVRVAFAHEDPQAVTDELTALGPVHEDPAALADVLAWLEAAAAGRPAHPAPACDLRLVPTPFAHRILASIAAVPPGTTISYSGLAAAAGRPAAVRAAASVCARNPVPLIIGCHRIVRSDGTPGRYRGGTALKTALIAREAAAAA